MELSFPRTRIISFSFPSVMLKHILEGTLLSSSPSFFPYSQNDYNSFSKIVSTSFFKKTPKLKKGSILGSKCSARKRIRYADESDDEEEYGYNEEISVLETYTESARNEALLVKAMVDEEEVEVLIFKGFSSSLSSVTSPDPSKSVLPARAVIKFIDRVKGPFDPSNIEYIEQGLTWEIFKSRLSPN